MEGEGDRLPDTDGETDCVTVLENARLGLLVSVMDQEPEPDSDGVTVLETVDVTVRLPDAVTVTETEFVTVGVTESVLDAVVDTVTVFETVAVTDRGHCGCWRGRE
jgi:hypothetical protein